jgi:hypothetical protein
MAGHVEAILYCELPTRERPGQLSMRSLKAIGMFRLELQMKDGSWDFMEAAIRAQMAEIVGVLLAHPFPEGHFLAYAFPPYQGVS